MHILCGGMWVAANRRQVNPPNNSESCEKVNIVHINKAKGEINNIGENDEGESRQNTE